MEKPATGKKRSFSVELKSKTHLKNFTLTNGASEGILIEGSLGELERAGFAEGVILEVIGTSGILRIDLGEDEIEKTQPKDQQRGEKTR
ncbi:MAG: hypothetical protein ACE14S_03250 [Candidatus Bathyarchaeia archaeon]